jgi:hypothetical protein
VAEKDSTGNGSAVEASADVSAEHVTLEGGFVQSVECETLEMSNSGAGLMTISGRSEMSQSGAGLIVADDEIEMFQAGCGVAVANRADVKQGFVGVLAASEARFDDESRVLITARDAMILGAVFGAVFGVVAAAFDFLIRGSMRR